MAGHSKWANIKRKKGIEDAKRGKLFTKLAKDITVAAIQGGIDVSVNPALRVAVEKAKQGNMPKKNIERAIYKGDTSGERAGHQVTYEGYGPCGVAFLVKAVTDNKNRTVAEIRSIFTRAEGSLAEAGAVSYMFAGIPPVASFFIDVKADKVDGFNKLLNTLKEQSDVVDVFCNAKL